MFKRLRKSPIAKLEREYAEALEKARDAQRQGDMPKFAALTAEAEEIGRRLDALEKGA